MGVCPWTFRLDFFRFHVIFSYNNVKAIKHGLSTFRLLVVGQKGHYKRFPFKCPKVNVILALYIELDEMMTFEQEQSQLNQWIQDFRKFTP